MAASDMGSTDSESSEYTCEYCCKPYSRKSTFIRHVRTHTNPFKCRICEKAFPSQMQRTKHILLHAGVQKFKCRLCPRKLLTKFHLKKHMESHTRGRYKCTICLTHFRSKKHVRDHFRTEHGCRNYSCGKCGLQYSDVAVLKSHVRDCTKENITSGEGNSPNDYSCKICDQVFSYALNLKVHLTTHSLDKSFECVWCKTLFVTRQACEVHQNTRQCVGPSIYQLQEFQDLVVVEGHDLVCRICQKKLQHQNCMKEHLQKHLSDKPYPCDVCGEHMPSENWLRRHTQTHRKSVLRFRCSGCKETFASIQSLLKHELRHGAERQEEENLHECEYCQRPFRTNQGKRIHEERMHLNIKEKKHICEICDQEFCHAGLLSNHKLLHSDNPVYSCEFCPMLYKTFMGLDAHMKKEHKTAAFDTMAYIPL